MAIHLAAKTFALLSSRAPLKPYSWAANQVFRRHLRNFPDLVVPSRILVDHVLVFPEPLNETPQTNELLRFIKSRELDIDFTKVDPFSFYKGFSQTMNVFEEFLTEIDEGTLSISDKSFKELMELMEKHMYPMDVAHNIFQVLIKADRENFHSEELRQLTERYWGLNSRRRAGQIRTVISNFMQRNFGEVTEAEKRLLLYYYDKSPERLAVSIGDQKIITILQVKLHKEKLRYVLNLREANQKFSYTIDDPDILAVVGPEFDDCQDLHHKERTPLKVTSSVFSKFMQLCPDRFIRKNVWQTYNKRCSPMGITKYNNVHVISGIRDTRQNIARYSGYKTHLQRRLEYAVADSRLEILDNLTALNVENKRRLAERLQELNDYAIDNSFEDYANLGIQEYDISYWTHKYKHEILIGKSEGELKRYFPLETVIKGIQTYFENYFGLEMKSIPRARYLYQDALHYDVYRNDQPLGNILFDPYSRRGQQTSTFFCRMKPRSATYQNLPSMFVNTPFHTTDQDSKKTYLTVTEIMDLFHHFAIVMQCLLSNYDYYELNVNYASELEVVYLLPKLCRAHLLSDHRILQACSDRGSSKSIDSELVNRVIKALTYFQSFVTRKQLYDSHLDIELSHTTTDIKSLVNDIYPIYSPFERDPDDFDYCVMEKLILGPMDGAIYSELWSEQLANFCLQEILPANGDMSSVDVKKIRDFNGKLLDTLFDPNDLKIEPKLHSLLGRSFKRSKPSLGVF